jgi:purine-binding chemotaxis protein CheW
VSAAAGSELVPVLAVATDQPLQRLVVVDVAGHRVGLPLDAVVEIHRAVQVAPLPDAPDVVLGLVNRRGAALPVLDLRRRLSLPTRQLHPDDHLVVVQLPEREVALLVDAAVDAVAVAAADVDEAVATSTAATYSHGVAVLPDGLLVVADVQRFLSSDESLRLDEALAAAVEDAR